MRCGRCGRNISGGCVHYEVTLQRVLVPGLFEHPTRFMRLCYECGEMLDKEKARERRLMWNWWRCGEKGIYDRLTSCKEEVIE